MSKASRDKGKRGERTAKAMLIERGYIILADTTAGLSTDDLVVERDGIILSVEVKNTKQIDIPAFVKQARTNAKKNHWLLMMHLDSTSTWLVMGSMRVPVCWHQDSTEI